MKFVISKEPLGSSKTKRNVSDYNNEER
jgi:hypothetical protein